MPKPSETAALTPTEREFENHGFVRVPGLYEECEIREVIETGITYWAVPAGADSRGKTLFRLYKRPSRAATERPN